MNMKSLEYFHVIAEEGSITKAAERLGMAQPPLTRRLQNLEKELGVTLFIRAKGGMTLTPEGEYLNSMATQIFNLVGKTQEELKNIAIGESGTVRVAAVESFVTSLFPDIIKSFRLKYPDVDLKISGTTSANAIEMVQKGTVDFAVARNVIRDPDLEIIDIDHQYLSASMAQDNKAARLPGDTISLKALSEFPLIIPEGNKTLKDSLLNSFASNGLQARIICECNPMSACETLAERGVGVAITYSSNLFNKNSMTKIIRKRIQSIEHHANVSIVKNRYNTVTRSVHHFILEILTYSGNIEARFS